MAEVTTEAWATPPEAKEAAEQIVKLEAELATVNSKLNDLYWIYTRCAKGRPPVLVAPELYARRREIEAELRAIRRRFKL